MKRVILNRIIATFCVLTLLFSSNFWTIPITSAGNDPSVAKIGSSLSLRVKIKTRHLAQSAQSRNLARNAAATPSSEVQFIQDTSDMNREKIFIRFSQRPTSAQLNELQSLGITAYPDSWIPPVGKQKTGLILADMPVEKLDTLAAKDYIVKLDTAEKTFKPQNDVARTTMGVGAVWTGGNTGAGVTVAVLDSGIDTANPDFPTLNSANSKDYSNYPTLDDTITNAVTGHGTHVAGSVLGRGVNSTSYKGAAPGADLVFLKIGGDVSSSASTAAIVGAIQAAVNIYHADIITMSYGGWSEYHDGSDAMCQAVDYAVSQGVTVFMAAGNDGNAGQHYSGTVNGNSDTGFIRVNVTGAGSANTALAFNLVWFDGIGTHNNLSLVYYNSAQLELSDDHVITGAQSESPRGTENASSYFDTYLPAGNGIYYLKVENTSPNNQSFHIYDNFGSPAVTFASPDPNYTLGSPAEADGAIAVGAYVSRSSWTYYKGTSGINFGESVNTIASFSSRGPRVDSVVAGKPDIVAPGSAIISVRDPLYTLGGAYDLSIIDNDGLNLNGSGPANYFVMQGTSMACPVAAGVGALLLSKNPTLTPAQVKQALSTTAADKGAIGFDNTYGWGLVNASAAVSSVSSVKISFTTGPQTITAGAASAVITIQTRDESDNPVSVLAATPVNLTSTSGSGVFSLSNTSWANITAVTIPAGSPSASFYYKDTIVGTPTISAASTGYTSGTQVETIVPRLLVSGFTTPASAGTAYDFTVTAQDGSGGTITSYAGIVHFTSSDSQAVLPADHTFTGAGAGNDNGTHTFSATLKTAESQSITATDTVTATITGTQSGITVNAAAKNKLIWGTQPPAAVTAGATWTAFTVKIADQYGNQTADTDSVTIVPAAGVLGGTLIKPAVAGLATFNDITRNLSGTLTLTATSEALTAAPASITVTVNPGAKNQLLWGSQPPAAVTAGATWTAFTVKIADQYGNQTADIDNVTIVPSAGVLGGTLIKPAVAGLATFNDITRNQSGPLTLTATSGSLTAAPASITVTVNAAAASQIRVETAANGSGSVVPLQNVAAGNSITVYAITRDQYANFIANAVGTWSLTSKTGGVADGDLVPAGDTKSAVFTGHLLGTAIIRVTSGILVSTDSGILTVVPKFSVAGYPASIAGTANSFTVTAQDGSGGTITSYAGIVHFTSSDSQAVLPADHTFTGAGAGNDNGTHTFSATLKTAGSQSITATDTVTATITGTQSGITVTAAVKNKLIWGTQPPAAVTAGATWTAFTVKIADQFGNQTADIDSVTIVPSAGVLGGTLIKPAVAGLATFNDITRNQSGTLTLTATSGSLVAAPASITVTVNAAAASQVRVETAANGSGTVVGAQNLVAGAGNTLTVYGITRDQYSNYIGNPANTAWSLTNKTAGVADSDLSTASGASVIMTGHLAGSAVIHAANGALTPGDSGTIFVTLLPPSIISIFTAPVIGASVDANLATQPVILVTDSVSSPVGGVTVTASRGTGTGTLRGTLTATTDAAGKATFTNLGYNKSGEAFTIHFAAGSLSVDSASLGPIATGAVALVRVETAANGSGSVVPNQNLTIGTSLTVYAITRDQYANFIANATGTWSFATKTGGVADGDLVPAGDNKSAVMTGHLTGTGIIHAASGGLVSTDSGTITVISGGGGGGGGGGGSSLGRVLSPGLTSGTTVYIGSDGVMPSNAQLKTTDGLLTLDIAKGTKMLTAEKNAVAILSAEPLTSPPAPPTGTALLVAYTFGPAGATFDPGITITMPYDPAKLPKDVAEKDLYIAFYNGTTWEMVKSTVDTATRTVSAVITHFSDFALMGKIVAPPTPTPSPSPTPVPVPAEKPTPSPLAELTPATVSQPAISEQATPTPTPAETTSQLPEQPSATSNLPLLIGIVVIVVAGVATFIVMKRRNTLKGIKPR